jgi:competence protein ComEA
LPDPAPFPDLVSPGDDEPSLPGRRPVPPLDWRDRLADLRRRVGADRRLLAWVLGGVVAVGVGLWLLRPAPTPVEETIPPATTTVDAPGGEAPGPVVAAPSDPVVSTTPTEIVAHAAGAVARPGVYRLDPAARVDDLVRVAGGLAPDADASRLNLAAPLADGTRVYVPRVGEEVPPAVGADGASPGPAAGDPGGPAGDEPEALVDLNTADEAALEELPGVGPATATAIITFREENGGFRSVDDLLDVRGIGEAKLEQLRPLVTV